MISLSIARPHQGAAGPANRGPAPAAYTAARWTTELAVAILFPVRAAVTAAIAVTIVAVHNAAA